MSKTHWKSLADTSQYLGKQHIDPDTDLIVTIEKVEANHVKDARRNSDEEKRILYFQEPEIRPLILNSTNGGRIEKLLGTPYTEEGAGHKIALFLDKTVPNNFGGEPGGIRVREYLPKVETAICAYCGKEITAHDKYNVNKIVELTRAKYGDALCWDCGQKRKEAAEL